MATVQQNHNFDPSPNHPVGQRCRHPRVEIVAREEDTEFVECIECREVFESSELRDMDIEDSFSSDA
jgi:hypothetical protein